jgi:hypothetical protein
MGKNEHFFDYPTGIPWGPASDIAMSGISRCFALRWAVPMPMASCSTLVLGEKSAWGPYIHRMKSSKNGMIRYYSINILHILLHPPVLIPHLCIYTYISTLFFLQIP